MSISKEAKGLRCMLTTSSLDLVVHRPPQRPLSVHKCENDKHIILYDI